MAKQTQNTLIDSLSATVMDSIIQRVVDGITPEAIAARLSGQSAVTNVREAYRESHPERSKVVSGARKQRRYTAQKVYFISPRRKNARDLELRSNDADVYNFLVKHPNSSARQIADGTKMKPKAVESSIWYLRNHDGDGNRLAKKNVAGPNALIQSKEND